MTADEYGTIRRRLDHSRVVVANPLGYPHQIDIGDDPDWLAPHDDDSCMSLMVRLPPLLVVRCALLAATMFRTLWEQWIHRAFESVSGGDQPGGWHPSDVGDGMAMVVQWLDGGPVAHGDLGCAAELAWQAAEWSRQAAAEPLVAPALRAVYWAISAAEAAAFMARPTSPGPHTAYGGNPDAYIRRCAAEAAGYLADAYPVEVGFYRQWWQRCRAALALANPAEAQLG